MRPQNDLIVGTQITPGGTVVGVSANGTVNSIAQWTNSILRASFQALITGTTTAGTLQLQFSDDKATGANANQFQPTNWTNLGSPVTVSNSGIFIIPAVASNVGYLETCYEYMRLVWTDTSAQVDTITAIADVSGNLNSKYWTFTSANGTGYYVWYNINSAGVDPAPPGLTGIQVAAATNASATTLGGDTRTAITSATPNGITVSGSTSGIILTFTAGGSVPVAADSIAAPTGFTFASSGINNGTIIARMKSIAF